MESCDILLGYFRQSLDFIPIGKGLLDGHFILWAEFHQENMDDVENEENECFVEFDAIAKEKDGDGDKVDQNEYSLTSDDPPVNQSSSGNNQVEYAYTKNSIRPHRSTYIIVTYLGWSKSRKLPARPQSKYQYQKPQRISSSW